MFSLRSFSQSTFSESNINISTENKLYSRLSNTSAKLISTYGKNIQLIEKTKSGTEYNPEIAETITTIKAVVSDVNLSVNNNIVQLGDKQFLIYYTGTITPDMMIRDDVDYQIIAINIIQPASNIILYSVIGRK